jgi:hypothetical protein
MRERCRGSGRSPSEKASDCGPSECPFLVSTAVLRRPDCRKVDKIDFLPDGGMVMHAGYMEVVVPRNFVKEVSEDADAHVCVSIATGTYRPICVFMPGTS